MNGNVKMFLRNALLGVLVVVLVPMLTSLLSSLIPVAALSATLFFGLSTLSIISTGVVAWLGAMLVGKINALK